MRTAIGLGSMAMLLAALPAAAMVPAHMQRRDELRRIINLPVLDRLGPVQRIELIAANTWRVTAGRCHVDVHIVERRLLRGDGRTPPAYTPRADPPVCER